MNDQETEALLKKLREREAAEKVALADWLVKIFFLSIPVVTCVLLLVFWPTFRHLFKIALALGAAGCVLAQVIALTSKFGNWLQTPRVVVEWYEKMGQFIGVMALILFALFFAAGLYFDFWGTLKVFLQ